MTTVDDAATVGFAGDLEREEAPVASLQHVRPSTHTGAWTALCAIGAVVSEAIHLLF